MFWNRISPWGKGDFFPYLLCDSYKYEAQIHSANMVQLRPVAVWTQCTLDMSSWVSQELLIQLHRLDNRLIWISRETQDKVNLTPAWFTTKHQIIWHKKSPGGNFSLSFPGSSNCAWTNLYAQMCWLTLRVDASDHSWSFLRWFLVQNWSNWTLIRYFKQPVKNSFSRCRNGQVGKSLVYGKDR